MDSELFKKAKLEAIKEVGEEKIKAAKEQIKGKLTELEDAEQVVKNLKRELEDLEDEIIQGN